MNSENLEAMNKIIDEADNPLEAFFAMLLYYLVHIIFRVMEVVVEFGTDTQESD